MTKPLLLPMRQREWKLFAALNFFLGGAGAGFYFLFWLDMNISGAYGIPAWVKLLPPALVSLGFLGLLFEAGRPLRSIYILRNVSSWITKEVIFGTLFGLCALHDFFFPDPAIRTAGAISGLLFGLSQIFVLYRAKGIIGWNVPLLPPILFTSLCVKGAALMLIIYSLSAVMPSKPVLWVSASGLILNSGLWPVYTSYLHRRGALEGLRRLCSRFFLLGAGNLFSFFIVSAMLLQNEYGRMLAWLAGTCSILGALGADSLIILAAGSYRPITAGEARPLYQEITGVDETRCRIIPIESARKK
jgi:hypothetical protein